MMDAKGAKEAKDAKPVVPPAENAVDPPHPHLSESETQRIHDEVVAALHHVYDPEIPINIYEVGLVYGVTVRPDAFVHVRMTLTSPSCPAAQILPIEVDSAARSVRGVRDAKVDIVWDPVWTPAMMSEAARLSLGLF